MRARLASRKVLTAVIALAGLGHAGAAFGQSTDEIEVFAYDAYLDTEPRSPPPIPGTFKRDSIEAYRVHQKVWGDPPIQTFYKNKPVVFLNNQDNYDGAVTTNYVPYRMGSGVTNKLEAASLYAIRQPRAADVAFVCLTDGQKNWCSNDHKGVSMKARTIKSTPWAIPILMSHEYIHLWQNKWMTRASVDAASHWFYEGTANGWGYGVMESVDRFQRDVLAQRLANSGNLKNFAFFLGLRYYDQPLDVDRTIATYPKNHPAYPQTPPEVSRETGINRCRDMGVRDDACNAPLTPEQKAQLNAKKNNPLAHEHIMMAGYMTGSFYRYMLLGRPSGAKAVEVMMKRPTPADRFADQKQQKRLLNWMNWMDEGIRDYKVSIPELPTPLLRPFPLATDASTKQIMVSVWPGGVRQIYSEMIAELADFPDTIVKNRRGYLNSRVYDSLLWSKGCPQIDLTGPAKAQSFTDVGLDIISARCLRVKVARNTGATASGSQSPSGFVVTVTHRADQDRKPTPRDEGLACIDLELASRGQVVRSPQMVTWTDKDTGKRHCSIQWVVPFDPLAPTTAGGNQGYQTVLLINASEKATQTIRRRVDVSIVQAQTDMKGNLVGTPEAKGDEQRPRKRIPIPQRTELQPLPAALSFRSGGQDENCDPYLRRVFKCGPTMKIGLMTGDANQMMQGTMNLATAYQKFDLRPGSSMADLGNVMAGGMTDAIADLTAQIARMQQSAAPPEGLAIDIIMAPVEFGQSGTFPARVVVNWSDGRDAGVLESLGPRGAGVFANGCLDDTNPPSQASVTIARHAPGIMVGTLAARLYERNEGNDACQRPFLEAGTLTASFATTGQLPALAENGGTSQIDTRPNERHMLEQMAMVAEMMEGAGALGGGAGAGGSGSFGGRASASGDPPATVATNAVCPAPGDVEAYLTMLIGQMTRAGVGRQEAEQMRIAYRELPPETLREAVCDWVAQGRPQ